MRLLVNAVGLRAGGGLTVGLNCLRGLRQARPEYTIRALVPADCGYEALCRDLAIPFASFAWTQAYRLWRPWFDQVTAARAAAEWGADVLFTMNNQPSWGAPCPQALLFHNPYYIYPAAEWWPLLAPSDRASLLLQRGLFRAAARRCARILVQTDVAAARLHRQYGIPLDRITTVPNALALEHDGPVTPAGERLAGRIRAAARGRLSVLTLARYYPHKDLEFIVRVAARLREAGDDRYAFFITIAAEQHPGARALLATIDRHSLGDRVINLGPIGHDELRGAHEAAEICLLPSVLESMSGTHLEALHYRMPIVTTNRDFARHACGDAARYFPPGDVDAAIAQLRSTASIPGGHTPGTHPAVRPRRWHQVAGEIAGALDEVGRRRAVRAARLPAAPPSGA